MGQAFMKLLNMSKQNVAACAMTPPLLWAGKKAQKEKAWSYSTKISPPPPFKRFRPIQLGWKHSPKNLWVDIVSVSMYMGWGEAFGHVEFDSFR